MPSDGSGTYTLPAGYTAVTGATIITTQHNPPLEDIAAGLTARLMRSGAGAMTGDLTLANSSPSSSLHAASKAYVDTQALAAVAALDIKPSVNVASTGNLTLSAEQTIDGVLTSASRVLVKNQTAPAENGIYLTGSGAWSRVTDMDAWTEVPGAMVAVEQGTIWADTLWFCTANLGGTLNTTAITWRRFDTNKLRRADTTTAITIAFDDHGRHITSSNAGAIATTLPQATTTFGFGFWFIIENIGAGANTITPTTSTINGAATLVLRTGDAYLITSDGANYRALNLGLNYATVTGLTEDATPDGNTDFVVTADASATLLKKVRPQNLMTAVGLAKTASYTVTDADRGSVIRFSGLAADATLTLPAAANRNGFEITFTNENVFADNVANTSAFGVICDPNAAELIDGVATRKTYAYSRITIFCDGTGWRTKSGFWRYFSGNQTISGSGSLTLAHGLGVRPDRIWCRLQNTTAELGYTQFDITDYPLLSNDGTTPFGSVVIPDATNLTIRQTTSALWFIVNKTTNANANITAASWRVQYYAEA